MRVIKAKIPNAAYPTPLASPEQTLTWQYQTQRTRRLSRLRNKLSPGTLKIEKIYTFYLILKTFVIWDMPP